MPQRIDSREFRHELLDDGVVYNTYSAYARRAFSDAYLNGHSNGADTSRRSAALSDPLLA